MSKKPSATKPIAITLAASLATATLLPVASASAHDTVYYHHHEHVHHHQRQRRNNNGDLIAAGIIGLAVGAIIADSANRSHQARRTYVERTPRYRPAPVYRPAPAYRPAPTRHIERRSLDSYNEPHVVRLEDELSLEPWTPGWYEWCDNRYRSFNARTGTYRGYDGLDHFCVPK